jgi:hypothetical protein
VTQPDLFGSPASVPEIETSAEFSILGEARISLRYTWDPSKPRAAFLMNNPSVAGQKATPFDQTAKRTIHFSKRNGCGSVDLVNWCPLIATDPADLWAMLAAGRYTEGLQWSNGHSVERAGRGAAIRVVACGPEGFRRYPSLMRRALQAFLWHYPPIEQKHVAHCLGVSPEGAPLHPLARGKFAIPNDTELKLWRPSWSPAAPFGGLL